MKRVSNIPEDVSTIKELAKFTEAAIEEVDNNAQSRSENFGLLPVSEQQSPSSGSIYYDDATDTLYIYSTTTGSFLPH